MIINKNNQKRRQQLKWNMIAMLTLCWFIPLMVISSSILYVVSHKISDQIENNILMSADKAIDTCQIKLKEAMTASKNASYVPDIKDGYNQFLKDGDINDLSRVVRYFLEQQYRFNSNFDMTYLYFVNDEEHVYTPLNSRWAEQELFKSQIKNDVEKISKEQGTYIAFTDISGRLYMIRNLVDRNYERYAVLVMELNKKNIFGGLNSIWGYHEGDVLIDGVSVFGLYQEDPCKDIISQRTSRSHYYHEGENSYVYSRLEADRHQIIYAVDLDTDTISYEMQTIWYLLGLFIAFMIPLVIIVFYFFHKKVNVPISGLRKACREIERENYGYHIQTEKMDEEFYYLDEAFNSMSDKLKNQFERIYVEELALRDARIMALQSQINPHFLNNTLEIINWEARMNGNVKVSTMIESLSTMLEATMNRKGETLIALSEELSYVDAYLYIIAQRFGDKLEVEKNIKQEFMRVKVPRLIIQPIIENAVEHGMDIRKKGKISIRVYGDGDKVYIEVMDNGQLTDMDRIKIARILNGENTEETGSLSLGIRNVNKRLKIIYGPQCGLTIKSNKDHFTVSTIIVKIDKAEEQ